MVRRDHHEGERSIRPSFQIVFNPCVCCHLRTKLAPRAWRGGGRASWFPPGGYALPADATGAAYRGGRGDDAGCQRFPACGGYHPPRRAWHGDCHDPRRRNARAAANACAGQRRADVNSNTDAGYRDERVTVNAGVARRHAHAGANACADHRRVHAQGNAVFGCGHDRHPGVILAAFRRRVGRAHD